MYDLTILHFYKSQDCFGECGFSASALSDQTQDLVFMDRKINVLQHLLFFFAFTVRCTYVFYFQYRFHYAPPLSCFAADRLLREVLLVGMAARSFFVYSMEGCSNISCTLPCSTAFPRFMTITRLHR